MKTININFDDAIFARVFSAVSNGIQYTGFQADGVTEQTQEQFIEKVLTDNLVQTTSQFEISKAVRAASISAQELTKDIKAL